MTRGIFAVALATLFVPPANAAIDVLQVPAVCGTMREVATFLKLKMPGPEEVGSGRDTRGVTVATLLTDDGYWALVAPVSAEKVCIIASGHEWTVGPVEAKSY